MLEAEDRGGREHGDLLAVPQRFESGAHDHFRLAEAHVSAEQPVHGLGALHVALDLFDGVELILGLGELESVLEFALPVAVGGEREAVGNFARGVKLQQLLGHVAHPGFDLGFGARPGGPAQPVERGLLRSVAASAKALHQVEPRQGYIQLASPAILDQHEVAFVFPLCDFPQPQEPAHPMLAVSHVVSGLQIQHIGRERRQVRLLGSRLGNQLGAGKQIFRSEYC